MLQTTFQTNKDTYSECSWICYSSCSSSQSAVQSLDHPDKLKHTKV